MNILIKFIVCRYIRKARYESNVNKTIDGIPLVHKNLLGLR